MMIESKLPNVGTTIFTRMSALAAECGALNLSQGFPDFDAPEALREAMARHVMAGHNQYAPMAGVMHLREQICGPAAACTAASAATRTPRSPWSRVPPRVFSAR